MQCKETLKLRVQIGDEEYDKLVAYNEVLNFIDDNFMGEQEGTWQFKKIISHQGPLIPDDPNYKGSSWNVLVHWETGEKSWEPLRTMAIGHSKVTLAEYGAENGLLDEPQW